MPIAGVSNYGSQYGSATTDTQRPPEVDKTDPNYIDAVFEDKNSKNVNVSDFINLMVEQLKNQDFMNPVDDTQYVTQLATFATMQQMQELAEYSKSTYTMGLVGKDVTIAYFKVGGDVEKITATVEKVSFVDNKYKVYVKGQWYGVEQIMEVGSVKPPEEGDKPESPEDGEGGEEVPEDTEKE